MKNDKLAELYNIRFIPLNLHNLEVNIINTINFFNTKKSITNPVNKKIIYHCIITEVINELVNTEKDNKNIITIEKDYEFQMLSDYIEISCIEKMYKYLQQVKNLLPSKIYMIESDKDLYSIDSLNMIRCNSEKRNDLGKLMKFIDNNDLIKVYQNYIGNKYPQRSALLL